MSPRRLGHGDDDDAIQTDRYLEALLAASLRRGSDEVEEFGVDPAVRAAARSIRLGLLPVHPAFRFEERLGRRLDAIARARWAALRGDGAASQSRTDWASGSTAGPGTGEIRRFPDPRSTGDDASPPPAGGPGAPGLPGAPGELAGVPRPVLIGGAVTSAALSLAGAVVVAWWRGRPPRSAMARAIRAAHDPGARHRPRRAGASAPAGDPAGRT